ncbi:MAG: protein-L-isoaspartate(D-aspartate) O-methyltransferase [Dehalococcoidia bacterium]|nr:protein-L-isoaspartate(D-aspartate) O-methyltransferase [Dehalococcoidia bacterium]
MIDFASERNNLIQHLRTEIKDSRVLQVMSRIPRELFIPEESRGMAYLDRPLPIGYGQTISQPLIVALMTESLGLSGNEKVLEIGAGSGYQTAILADLAARVISIERVPQLIERAKKLLELLEYNNIEIHLALKELGWPEGAPYNKIMVTAASPVVPLPLVDQLTTGGKMVIPVGSIHEQELVIVTKYQDRIEKRNLGACRFVPLIGEGAWLSN